METVSEPKSRSRETTFEQDLHPRRDLEAIRALIRELSEQVARDLARGGYGARTVGVKVRYDDFTRATRELSLSRSTSETADIVQAALACLDRLSMHRRIRLLGVKASNLERGGEAGPPASSQLF